MTDSPKKGKPFSLAVSVYLYTQGDLSSILAVYVIIDDTALLLFFLKHTKPLKNTF